MRCLSARLHPGQLTEHDLVLLAVNNNAVTTACGGSHWCVRSKLKTPALRFAVSGEPHFIATSEMRQLALVKAC